MYVLQLTGQSVPLLIQYTQSFRGLQECKKARREDIPLCAEIFTTTAFYFHRR